MSNNETIAMYLGWKQVPETGFWIDPNNPTHSTLLPDFTTDYNFVVPAWNKAVEQLGVMSGGDGWELYYKIYDLDPKFEIETRMPLLLEIITFLQKQK